MKFLRRLESGSHMRPREETSVVSYRKKKRV